MPEIIVSEEQRAFLESLREDIQSEVRYGHVRPQDALQYLIDNYDGHNLDVELPDSSTDGSSAGTPTEDGSSEEAAAAAAVEEADDDDEDDDDSSSASGDDGEDRLHAMMNLLDTHDGKWREATKEDARYEVDMPDGTTAYVQTKDDVRARLFKNY
jgi:hypothetical protein